MNIGECGLVKWLIFHLTIPFEILPATSICGFLLCLDLTCQAVIDIVTWNCRSNVSLLSTSDCVSPKQRRWPEDIAWHPYGDRLFCVYTADGGDSQISVLNLNSSKEVRNLFWSLLAESMLLNMFGAFF